MVETVNKSVTFLRNQIGEEKVKQVFKKDNSDSEVVRILGKLKESQIKDVK